MRLYDYYRSSSSYRVRIALNYKRVPYDIIPVHLLNNGGEQNDPDYVALNPQKLVPTLDNDGKVITQSLAILEYLEETIPSPSLLPEEPFARAQVRSLASIIACDIHPLNNLRVLQTLKQRFDATEAQVTSWYHLWLEEGFAAIEAWLKKRPREGRVCYGDSVTMADICLIPQVYNALRYNFSLEPYPIIRDINEYCLSLSEFNNASPDNTQ